MTLTILFMTLPSMTFIFISMTFIFLTLTSVILISMTFLSLALTSMILISMTFLYLTLTLIFSPQSTQKLSIWNRWFLWKLNLIVSVLSVTVCIWNMWLFVKTKLYLFLLWQWASHQFHSVFDEGAKEAKQYINEPDYIEKLLNREHYRSVSLGGGQTLSLWMTSI